MGEPGSALKDDAIRRVEEWRAEHHRRVTEEGKQERVGVSVRQR